jgi:hypothetical protein
MIDFPANPTVGQKFTAVGISWTWDGTKWSGSAGSGATVSASDTPPANPALGTLWWDSVGGQLYIYYNDGNSSQWVIAVNYGFGLFLPIAGGTLTGPLTLSGNPVAPLQPATKQYVDALPPAAGTNRIINGDMRIDQRNNGASGTAIGYTIDRWQYSASQASKGQWQRWNGSSLPGFPYGLNLLSLSAYTLLASDYFRFMQTLEADTIGDFAWGTPQAQPVTLSFWVYSTVAGTFGGSVTNVAGTRSYPFSYSIPVASTWTKIIINIPGDTSGAWVLSGNAGSMNVNFSLGAGANFSGAAWAWASASLISATGAVSLVAINSASFYVTGVKLEIGSVATPFNRKSLSESFSDCQRYYQQGLLYSVSGANIPLGTLVSTSTMPMTAMRAAPTMTALSNSSSNYTLTNLSSSSQTIGSTIGMWTNGTATAAGIVSINIAFAASAEL